MKLEKIYWRDICGISNEQFGWSDKEKLLAEAERLYNMEYISVGYVVFEDERFVIIAATRDADLEKEEMYHDASMIMKSVITRREPLYTGDNLPG